jgi:outer membrane protein assembly factor BamB
MRSRVLLAILTASSLVLSTRPAAALAPAASLVVSPAVGPPTTRVTLTGAGFQANEAVSLTFDGAPAGQLSADGQGGFSATKRVPRNAKPGDHVFAATGLVSGISAQAAYTVRTNWTQFRFDSNRTGFQPFENVLNPANVPSLHLDWQAQLGAIVDYSSPVVVNGVVYIGSSDGVLWAFPAAGCGQALCTQPLWKSTSVAQIMDSPVVAEGMIFIGSQTSFVSNDGKLNAFAAGGCGQPVCPPLWQGLAGDQSILMSSPAVANGVVYVGAYDHKLYAFAAHGCGQAFCDPLWTGATDGTIESSPTVAGGVVYVGSDDGYLYAFDANGCGQSECQPLWTGAVGYPIFDSSPAVASGTVYVGSAHALAAFPAGGCGQAICQPAWRGMYGESFFAGSPAIYQGRVYIGLETGLGVFPAGGCGEAVCDPLWLDFGSGFQAVVASSPTVAGGVVYAGRNTAEVLAWAAAPCGEFICSEIWKGMTNDEIVTSSPTVVDGKVYIGSGDKFYPTDKQGRIYVFDVP